MTYHSDWELPFATFLGLFYLLLNRKTRLPYFWKVPSSSQNKNLLTCKWNPDSRENPIHKNWKPVLLISVGWVLAWRKTVSWIQHLQRFYFIWYKLISVSVSGNWCKNLKGEITHIHNDHFVPGVQFKLSFMSQDQGENVPRKKSTVNGVHKIQE